MERGINSYIRTEKLKFFRTKTILSISIVLFLFIAAAVYFTFFLSSKCETFECLKESMIECKRVTYINEEPEASWLYSIKGEENNQCIVDVKLVIAKEGELEINNLVGYSMECSYPIGVGEYPERDLSKCHGRLKEELQTIIIKKLHSYIIENLGSFDSSLNKAV